MAKVSLRDKSKIKTYLKEVHPKWTDQEIIDYYNKMPRKERRRTLALIGKAKFGEKKHTFKI